MSVSTYSSPQSATHKAKIKPNVLLMSGSKKKKGNLNLSFITRKQENDLWHEPRDHIKITARLTHIFF